MIASKGGGANAGARDHPRERPRVLQFPAAPGTFLVSVAGGRLYYRDGTEAEGAPGIWLDQGKKGGRYLLQAPLQVTRTLAGDHGYSYTVVASPPEHTPVTLHVTQDNIEDGSCWSRLRGGLVGALPVTEADNRNMLAALDRLAAISGALRQELVPALAWQEINGRRYWIDANGAIDSERLYTVDQAPALSARQDLPQTLPQGALPPPDASALEAFLTFWPDDVTLFALAAIGACAEINKPYTDVEQPGRARYDLEVFGPTGIGKTSLLNFLLRLFSGASFGHETTPQLKATRRAGDTGIGEQYLRHILAYRPYADQDCNARPGHPDYERQQQRRLDMNAETGDRSGGGERSKRRGGGEQRPPASGLLIRQGEPPPYDYSVSKQGESQDARAVTFVMNVPPEQLTTLQFRGETGGPLLWTHAAEADALRVAWLRYLANEAPADLQARRNAWQIEIARQYQAERELQQAEPHSRALQQVQSLCCGLLEYCRFLRAEAITRGAEIADLIEHQIPALVADRVRHADYIRRLYSSTGHTTEANEAQRLRDAVYTLATEYHHATDKEGKIPAGLNGRTLALLGWTLSNSEKDERRPRGTALFWLENSTFFVTRERLRARLQEKMHLNYNALRLRQLLQEAGLLIPNWQKGKNALPRMRGIDGRDYYLPLRLDALLENEPEPEAPGDHQTAPEPEATPAAEAATRAEPEAAAASPATQPETPERADWFDLLDALPPALRETAEAYQTAKAYWPHRERMAFKSTYDHTERKGVALFKHLGDTYRHGNQPGKEKVTQALQQIRAKCEAKTRQQQPPAAPGALPF